MSPGRSCRPQAHGARSRGRKPRTLNSSSVHPLLRGRMSARGNRPRRSLGGRSPGRCALKEDLLRWIRREQQHLCRKVVQCRSARAQPEKRRLRIEQNSLHQGSKEPLEVCSSPQGSGKPPRSRTPFRPGVRCRRPPFNIITRGRCPPGGLGLPPGEQPGQGRPPCDHKSSRRAMGRHRSDARSWAPFAFMQLFTMRCACRCSFKLHGIRRDL